MNKKYSLMLYVLLTFSIAFALWGLNLWEPKNIVYGSLTVLFQVLLIDIIFKHRKSEQSFANYLFVVPTALFMLLIINNVSTPLSVSILISLVMLIPIHFLEKYILYSYADK